MNWRAFISGVLIASFVLVFGFFETPQKASAANQVVIFLFANFGKGNQTFNVPPDWNSSINQIDCIGSGGTGIQNLGGGGGAWARISNLTLTQGGTATYAIGGSATTTAGGRWNETYFNGTASSTASLSCAFGKNGGTGAGGSTANSTGTSKNAGGNAAATTAKGGGGAGGPTAAGQNGAGGNGGTGDFPNGGLGGEGGQITAGDETGFGCTDGGYGTEYSDFIGANIPVGSGGGGGGGVLGFAAGCFGGAYGGGGGGRQGAGTGGGGYPGIIIIYYTPSTSGFTGVLAKFRIQGGRVLIRGGRVLIR